jgi:(1->4)-alpha-D-glucan 1-alpha-D-glucosylmutase
MLRRWFDGRVKLFTTWRALEVRARRAETFRRGGYRAIASTSPNVVSFLRGDDVLIATPRFPTRLTDPGRPPLAEAWGEETLELGGRWRNAFTGEVVEAERLRLADIFATFPVAMLELESGMP